MTESQGWWLIIELAPIAVAAAVSLVARLIGR
jgi:hypothetical protein